MALGLSSLSSLSSLSLTGGRRVGPVPPEGFAFVVDDEGNYLVDDDGTYLTVEAW